MTPPEPHQPVDGPDSAGASRLGQFVASVAVAGRRTSVVDLLGALLFAGIIGFALFSGGGSGILLLLAVFALMNLWVCLALFVRRPRVAVDGGVFFFRMLAAWDTPAENVAGVELRAGKLAVTLSDVQLVEPASRRAALAGSFNKRGYHQEAARGVFSLQQVNALRAALGMPLQAEDRFAQFEAALRRLTPRVVVTPSLVAANLIVFVLMLVRGANPLLPDVRLMVDWGANDVSLTSTGQWWRLLSAMFLHFGAIHLLVNMWILRDIGRVVERLVGNSGFLLGYLISGFFGGAASVFWHESTVSAGASGAVFGIFGMLLGFMLLHQQSIPAEVIKDHRGNAIAFVLLNIVIGLSIPWIDQAAHLGGFLAGFLCGLVLGCDLTAAASQRAYRNLALAAGGATLAAFAIAMLPARPPDLGRLGVRIDEVDAEAFRTYEAGIAAVQAGKETADQSARRITTTIVPRYDELAASLGEARSQDGKRERVRSVLVEYVKLRRQGWVLLADAIKTNNLLQEGLAIEKFEAALAALAGAGLQSAIAPKPATDLRTELAVLMVAEDRALRQYDRLAQRHAQGGIDDHELADRIERDVLPVWEKGQKRFLAAAKNFSQEQPVVARMENYLNLKKEGWTLLVESLRENDQAKSIESARKLDAAARAAEGIWKEK